MEFVGSVADPGAPLPGELPQIAFAGRSNVGKSSLINVLIGRTRKKLAHVSSRPGKTRLLNFYRVNDDFLLVDLPGFGFAKVPGHVREEWRRLVEGYLARGDGPKAVVHLVDVRRDPTDPDLTMLDYLARLELPTVVVLTKVDKLNRSRREKAVPALIEGLGLDPEQVVPFSAVTGEGRDLLLEAIGGLLGKETAR